MQSLPFVANLKRASFVWIDDATGCGSDSGVCGASNLPQTNRDHELPPDTSFTYSRRRLIGRLLPRWCGRHCKHTAHSPHAQALIFQPRKPCMLIDSTWRLKADAASSRNELTSADIPACRSFSTGLFSEIQSQASSRAQGRASTHTPSPVARQQQEQENSGCHDESSI